MQGKYNVEDAEDKYALIIGNGTSNDNRSNTIAIDWDGNIICYGDEISINEQVDNNTRKLSGIDDNANNYIHPTYTSHSKGMYKFANDGLGHVSDAEAVTKEDIVALGIPEKDTTYTGGNSDYGDVYIDENNTIFIPTAVGKRTDTNLTSEIFNDYENNTAAGVYSRASGTGCHTSGNWASSGGALCNALGDGSFAYGYGVKTSGYCQTAFGQYNENGNYIFEIGNGSSNTKRSNALSVDANGCIFCDGDETSLNAQIDANTKKLSGIDVNANNYVHPATSGNKHIPSGGSSGQILRWLEDGTAIWGEENDTEVESISNIDLENMLK